MGLAVYAGSALALLLTGGTGVRYTADHQGTIPMWFRWVPALVGIALVRLVPLHERPSPEKAPGRGLRVQAVVLLAAAALFAVGLRLLGGGEPAHTALKLLLLLGVPAVLFWVSRRRRAWKPDFPKPQSWQRFAPAIPVLAWLLISYATPLAVPVSADAAALGPAVLVAVLVLGFALNALLEEVFYRRWLQTRWEFLLGRWPAIVLASLFWAVWHIGIQGTGPLGVDLASVVVNQGVQGLFLGYLWSRYREMWPLLTVHGATNALPLLISLL
ncbi:CAAX protease self-immunity [Streptoalloteichus hindustanus]|uniref:CAAX protease self-immunity n=1 Tax=Streptoalloteichus hindustanus TaxID=2017 RepID=A0A1M5PHV4_STRHI|nr:CAAX protease self-immunity [Streptoalloteichus hindustanus]